MFYKEFNRVGTGLGMYYWWMRYNKIITYVGTYRYFIR